VSSSNRELGPFGKSFIGDFPTSGTLWLLAASFLLSAVFSLGNVLPFLILIILSSLLSIYMSYNFIEPHFNNLISLKKQRSLSEIEFDKNNLSIGDIGKLLYGFGKSKERWWNFSDERPISSNFSELDTSSSSIPISIGASNKTWLSWLIIVFFGISFLILTNLLPFIFILPLMFINVVSFNIYLFVILLSQILMIPIIILFIHLDGSLNRIKDMLYFGSVKRILVLTLLIPIIITIVDFILIMVYGYVYFSLFGEPSVNIDLGVAWNSSRLEIFLLFLIVAIAAPIAEELMFRGYVLDSIQRLHGVRVAIILSAFFFGLIHLLSGPYVIGTAMIGGLIYGWIRVRTGSLLPPIAAHMMWNSMALIITYL